MIFVPARGAVSCCGRAWEPVWSDAHKWLIRLLKEEAPMSIEFADLFSNAHGPPVDNGDKARDHGRKYLSIPPISRTHFTHSLPGNGGDFRPLHPLQRNDEDQENDTGSQESRGARDGREAYERLKRGADGGGDRSSEYWKNYWRDYFKEYWRDYWRQRYEGREDRSYRDREYREDDSNDETTERRPERRRESPSDRSERGSRDIVKAAVDSVGKRMYEPMLSYSMGRLGCAASVSGVLKEAGYKYANSALVYGLHNQLLKNGWQKLPVSEARPGDVIIGIRRSSWQSGGGGSHIGIVGDNGTTYHNSSARRHWIEDTLARWNTRRYPRGVFVLRPPTN